MTEDQLRYLQLIHRTARDLEELRRRGPLPADILQRASSMGIIHIGEVTNQLQRRHPELAADLATRLPEVN